MAQATSLAVPLTERFKTETGDIHRRVEKHPFLSTLVKEELTHVQFFAHIVDLHLVYDALEDVTRSSLEREERIKPLYFPKLERAKALKKDISAPVFTGLVQTPSTHAKGYAAHLHSIAETFPLLLLSHAYTRYLGDLSGGQMLKKHIANQWPDAVHFYDFKELFKSCSVEGAGAFKNLFKERLNAVEMTPKEQNALVNETKKAFALSEKLFDAVISRHLT